MKDRVLGGIICSLLAFLGLLLVPFIFIYIQSPQNIHSYFQWHVSLSLLGSLVGIYYGKNHLISESKKHETFCCYNCGYTVDIGPMYMHSNLKNAVNFKFHILYKYVMLCKKCGVRVNQKGQKA